MNLDIVPLHAVPANLGLGIVPHGGLNPVIVDRPFGAPVKLRGPAQRRNRGLERNIAQPILLDHGGAQPLPVLHHLRGLPAPHKLI